MKNLVIQFTQSENYSENFQLRYTDYSDGKARRRMRRESEKEEKKDRQHYRK